MTKRTARRMTRTRTKAQRERDARSRSPPASHCSLFTLRVYDPRANDSFEPRITWGVMTEWAVGSDRRLRTRPSLSLEACSAEFQRCSAATEVTRGGRLQTECHVQTKGASKKRKGNKLSCRVPMGTETVPLYTLDSREELERVAAEMKNMWRTAAESARASG